MACKGLNRKGIPWNIADMINENNELDGKLEQILFIGEEYRTLKDRYSFIMENFDPDDCMFLASLSVLSRSIPQAISILQLCDKIGVKVVSLYEGYDSRNPVENYTKFLSIVSRFGRARNKELTQSKDGRYESKKRYSKGKNVDWTLYPGFDELYERLKEKAITKVEFASKLGVSRPTLDKLVNRRRDEEEIRKQDEALEKGE